MLGVAICCSVLQAHKGAPLTGVLLCRSVHQALKGAPWMGWYSVAQCIRPLMGPPLYCSAAQCWCVEREAMMMAPLPTCDSAVPPCFHGCQAFLHMHFPLRSTPSHPLYLSFHSQQQPLHWDFSTIPKLQHPAAALPGDRVPEQCMYDCDCGKNCLILITFRLTQISCFTLSLKYFSSYSDNCPAMGIGPRFSSPTHPGQVQSY